MKSLFRLFALMLPLCVNGSASLTLTVKNPNQTAPPGARAVYLGTLSNTDAVAYTVVTFTAINPPTDATSPPTANQLFPIAEPAVPFTIGAGEEFNGVIMEITVPAGSLFQNHSFAVEAVTNSHDTAGNSIASNSVALNLTVAHRAGEGERFSTKLSGFSETPPVLTDGTGSFTAILDSGGTSLSYTLTYAGMSSAVTQSHIHFAQSGVPGSIVVFLCSGSKPACPASGTVTGTITGADVLAVTSQGVTAGDFSELLRILRSGDAYANVHTANHPAGEIRGQLTSRAE